MEHYLWVERYRPKTIGETVLPARLKDVFNGFAAQKDIPNLLLTGPQGSGKTTVARALVNAVGGEYIIINGSMKGNIDTLRNEIREYASSMSMTGGRKYVILDEADYLNPQSTQPALRNFMEEFSANCGFILTCNYPNKIIKELHSRCSVIDFSLSKDEKQQLSKQIFAIAKTILDENNVDYDDKPLAVITRRHAPDWRRVFNELQKFSADGKISPENVAAVAKASFTELLEALKTKNFSQIRIWVGQHTDVDSSVLFRFLYDNCSKMMDPPSAAQLVLIIAKYQYQEAFVADKEINTTAALTEIMVDCSWK